MADKFVLREEYLSSRRETETPADGFVLRERDEKILSLSSFRTEKVTKKARLPRLVRALFQASSVLVRASGNSELLPST